MTAARCQMFGCRPVEENTVFDIAFAEYEIADRFCQIQMRATRREGCESFTVDWGDGTVQEWSQYELWHNYTKAPTTGY